MIRHTQALMENLHTSIRNSEQPQQVAAAPSPRTLPLWSIAYSLLPIAYSPGTLPYDNCPSPGTFCLLPMACHVYIYVAYGQSSLDYPAAPTTDTLHLVAINKVIRRGHLSSVPSATTVLLKALSSRCSSKGCKAEPPLSLTSLDRSA